MSLKKHSGPAKTLYMGKPRRAGASCNYTPCSAGPSRSGITLQDHSPPTRSDMTTESTAQG